MKTDISRKEDRKSAVEHRRHFASRRRLGRTSSCGIVLNTRFDVFPNILVESLDKLIPQ